MQIVLFQELIQIYKFSLSTISQFDLGQKMSLDSLHFLLVVFLPDRNFFLEQKQGYFQKLKSLFKEKRAKEEFSNSLGHSIYELYIILENFAYTASKGLFDI